MKRNVQKGERKMKSKAIAAIMVTMLLVGMVFYVLPVKAQNVIKIGVIGPVGWPQMDGMIRGAELAQDWINGPGGGIVIGGTRYDVQLFFANEPAEMLGLITAEQVDFVIGGFRSQNVFAMREVAMNYKTIFFICGAATNELIDCGTGTCGACVRCDYARYKYLFRVTLNQTTLLKNLVGFLKEYVIPQRLVPLYGSPVKVAVLAEDLTWTDDKYDAIVYGGALGPNANVVFAARTPYPTTDFSSYIAAMNATKVRLVVHIYSGPDSLALVLQMKVSPLKAVACGIDAIGQCSEAWDLTGGGCEYTAFLASTGTRSPVSTISQPYNTTEVWDNCWAEYDSAPIYTMWGVYDGIIALADTLSNRTGQLTDWIYPPYNQNAGGTADQLVPIIAATARNGVLGRFKYTTYHDPFSNEYLSTWIQGFVRPLVVQWQSGRLEVVWPADRRYSKRWCLPEKMYPYPTDVIEDAKVDTEDISAIGYAFGSYPAAMNAVPHPRWQFTCDVEPDDAHDDLMTQTDNFIEFEDLVPVAWDFAKIVDVPLSYCSEPGHMHYP